MKYDYINIVNFRLHDDYTGIRWSECGDNNIFIDGNGNGPYDFRFSKVRKYYFYGELPEKYILNITTGDFRNAPENGIFKTIKSNHRILKDLKDGNTKILINRIGEFDTFINGKLSDSEYTTLIHNLFKKVWDLHKVNTLSSGQSQLFIGLHLVHEVTSPQAFQMLRDRDLRILHPERTFATADHIS